MIKLKTGEKIMDHTELGISFREWCALFAAWGVLANGMLPHTPRTTEVKPDRHLFNMNVSCDGGACGTVGCIGGTMALAMGMDAEQSVGFVDWSGIHTTLSQGKFYLLFYPRKDDGHFFDWAKIDGIHAAEAIWNFLRTGSPHWDNIVPHMKVDATYKPYKGKVLPHDKLGIKFEEWLALIGVRVMLDCGAVDHARHTANWNGAHKFLREHEGVHAFNMGQPLEAANCGTVGCIGGYMGAMMFDSPHCASGYVMNRHPECGDKRDTPLADLFFPRIDGYRCMVNYDKIDTKTAVQAIDNFLTTGKPNWEKVLAK